MRFQTTIDNQPLTLDYATNGGNQVCHVGITDQHGADLTDCSDYTLLHQAWTLARDHHTRTEAAQVPA